MIQFEADIVKSFRRRPTQLSGDILAGHSLRNVDEKFLDTTYSLRSLPQGNSDFENLKTSGILKMTEMAAIRISKILA